MLKLMYPIVNTHPNCHQSMTVIATLQRKNQLMIDPNLYHIIKDQISAKDPKRIYKELLSHFAGHKQHHIEHATVTLESHTIHANETKNIVFTLQR